MTFGLSARRKSNFSLKMKTETDVIVTEIKNFKEEVRIMKKNCSEKRKRAGAYAGTALPAILMAASLCVTSVPVYAQTDTPETESTQETHNVYATAGVGGRISDNKEGYTAVGFGDSITYSFTPNEDYRIKDVLVDNESVGAVEEYTFENVTEAHTIKVTFTKSAEDASFEEKMADLFQDARNEIEYWPETRWWLAEGLTTEETLKESIDELYEDGIGAVEIVTLDIGALSEDEELNARYAWGSDEWNEDTQFIIEYCTEKGMGVSVTSGTHWGNANLPEEAFESYIEENQESFTEYGADSEAAQQVEGFTAVDLSGEGVYELINPIDSDHKLRLEAALLVKVGEDNTICVSDVKDITDQIQQATDDGDGELIGTGESVWTYEYAGAEDGGTYQIFAVWQYGSWGTSSPSVSTNYTINYMSKEGMNLLKEYWEENIFTDELKAAIQENGDVSFYMDSLEGISASAWSQTFMNDFEESRGYSLLEYLTILGTQTSSSGGFGAPAAIYTALLDEDGNDITEQVYNDLRQVRTECYINNCLQELTDWAHEFGMKLRAENSYGVNGFEASEPIKALDWVETESLEFVSEPDSYRIQAGGVHVYDKVYSSETGANNYANYRYDNETYRNIFYTQFASTIARTVFHGYSALYGPEGDVDWPGFEGMEANISMRVSSRQPNSEDYAESLMPHLTRLQTALRQGVAQIDLAVLRTDYNIYNDYFVAADPSSFNDGGNDYSVNDLRSGKSLYWQALNLQNAGYTYDYWSPILLDDEDAHFNVEDGVLYCVNGSAAYQALIIYQEAFPAQSMDDLEALAAEGLPIIFVNNGSEYSKTAGGMAEYTEAASASLFLDADDAEIAAFRDALTADYENVISVDSEDDVLGALEEMGIQPRAAFGESNNKLMTTLRKDSDASYLYVYNYQYSDTEDYAENNGESYAAAISVEGEYKPYVINTWSGEVEAAADYYIEDGRTVIYTDLAGGDVALYALDPNAEETLHAESVSGVKDVVYDENGNIILRISESGEAAATLSDGTVYAETVEAPDDLTIDSWNLTVESWTKGELDVRTEDKEDKDYTSTEITYLTDKTDLDAGELTELVSWSEIDAIGDGVSGVGTYTAVFTLPDDWNKEDYAAYFSVDSFCGGTAQLTVNGQNAYVDMDSCSADITDYVQAGENTIEVRVTTSLWNALIAEGLTEKYTGADAQGNAAEPESRAYGMVGTAEIILCTAVNMNEL